MRKMIFILLAVLSCNVFALDISGTWYRNYLYASAELIIDDAGGFSIEAVHTAHHGFIEGTIRKIRDDYYYAFVEDAVIGQACLIVFAVHPDFLEVKIYGDKIGAGARVYYDGKYDTRKMTRDERNAEALGYILETAYDADKVKELLKEDLEYFVDCFGTRFIDKPGADTVIIEGFMPGVAPWQNGIIKTDKTNIYMVITDSRGDGVLFRYYSNKPGVMEIPEECVQWIIKNWNEYSDFYRVKDRIIKPAATEHAYYLIKVGFDEYTPDSINFTFDSGASEWYDSVSMKIFAGSRFSGKELVVAVNRFFPRNEMMKDTSREYIVGIEKDALDSFYGNGNPGPLFSDLFIFFDD